MKIPIAIIISGIIIASAIIISGHKPKYDIQATTGGIAAFSKDGLVYHWKYSEWIRLQDDKRFDKLP